MNYHDYIWDLGGTLLDNYESSTRAFVETLKEFGYQQQMQLHILSLKKLIF